MVQPDTSERNHLTCDVIESDLPFDVYLSTRPPSVDTYTTTSGWYRSVLAMLAVLVPFCFGLLLVFREPTVSVHALQAHLARTLSSSGLNNLANGRNTLEQQKPQTARTHVLAPHNATFVRRQDWAGQSIFYIPIASRQYQFMSRGLIAPSTFKVKRYSSDKASSVSNYLKVVVKISRNPKGTAKAYTIGNGRSVTGVVLSAPNDVGRGMDSWPRFEVLVHLPVTSRQRRQLNSLDIRLSGFQFEFDNLSYSFVFSRISVASAAAHMNLGAISATDLRVSNTNGNIRLGIVSAKNVAICTTFGRLTYDSINGDTVLLQNRGQIDGAKTTTWRSLRIVNVNWGISGEFTLMPGSMARLSAQNAPIVGRIILKQDKKVTTAPTYNIQATNSNHPLSLKVVEQPLQSSCNLEATSSSNVRVHMPRAFEGRFRVIAAQNKLSVETAGKRDPARRGRQRFVEYSNPRSKDSGRTGWGKPNDRERHGAGTVTLRSTGGQAQLVFD